MEIRLTRNVRISGEPHNAGQVVDVAENDGKNLIAMKKAVALEAAAPEPRETGETEKPKSKSEKGKPKGK